MTKWFKLTFEMLIEININVILIYHMQLIIIQYKNKKIGKNIFFLHIFYINKIIALNSDFHYV